MVGLQALRSATMPPPRSQTDVKLFIVPIAPEYHDHVCDIHYAQKLRRPPEPKDAIVVVNENRELVASLYIFEARPFSLGEFFVGNSEMPATVVHQAGGIVIEQWLSSCAQRGLTAVCAPNAKGVIAGLRRHGFQDTGCTMLICHEPAVPVTVAKRIEKAPPDHSDGAEENNSARSGATDHAMKRKIAKKVRSRKKKVAATTAPE